MSSKIDISTVAEVLKHHSKTITPATLREIVEELNSLAADKTEATATGPQAKQQFVILVSDPSGKVTQDLVGWVCQIPETDSPASLVDRINLSAHDFNATKKGRLIPVKSVGEAMESVSRKHLKEHDVRVKTKLPVAVLVTDNKLSEPPTA